MSQFSMALLLSLSFFRILLEFAPIPWERLPLARFFGQGTMGQIHRWGLYFSIGYFVLFLPEFIAGLLA